MPMEAKRKTSASTRSIATGGKVEKAGNRGKAVTGQGGIQKMRETIVSFVTSNGTMEECTFKTYLGMASRLRAPFKTVIDGQSITVSAADTTIMLKQSAIEVIKKHAIGEK